MLPTEGKTDARQPGLQQAAMAARTAAIAARTAAIAAWTAAIASEHR